MAVTRHGYTSGGVSPEHRAWSKMKERCYRPNARGYENYGGRNITVYDGWLNSFENFIANMGDRPSPQHSIDRKDVNGNYEPDNCKWSTKEEQMRNRRVLKTNKTGVNGVYRSPTGKKFCAQINHNGIREHLGTFDTIEEAEQTRNEAEKQYWVKEGS